MSDKQLTTEMPTTYDPKASEAKWYDYWMKGNYFEAGKRPDAETYTIVIPPPNVTGMLHIGHALDFTLQDILYSCQTDARLRYTLASRHGPCRNCYADKGGAEAS